MCTFGICPSGDAVFFKKWISLQLMNLVRRKKYFGALETFVEAVETWTNAASWQARNLVRLERALFV